MTTYAFYLNKNIALVLPFGVIFISKVTVTNETQGLIVVMSIGIYLRVLGDRAQQDQCI